MVGWHESSDDIKRTLKNRLKKNDGGCPAICSWFFFFWNRASARPCGTIQCRGGNRAHERPHCGETYELQLHQRCLLAIRATVRQKSAVCYFSFGVYEPPCLVISRLLQWALHCPFSSLFLFAFRLCICMAALRWTNYMILNIHRASLSFLFS